MTISVQVSCNGNYKCPITYSQGEAVVALELSGRGKDGPDIAYIPFQHGGEEILNLAIGPEQEDNGE